MIPRFGAPPRPDKTYIRRPGAYAILPRGPELLMTMQTSPTVDLQLPGGGIDPGETAVMALHREVYEETGWTISAPRWIGTFRRFVFMPEYDLWAEKVCQIFVAQPVLHKGPPIEPHHVALWMTPERALAELENDGDRYFLNRYLQAR